MTTPSSELDMNHWLYRLIAYIIDSLIIGIPIYLIYYFAIEPLIWPRYAVWNYTYSWAPWYASWFLFPLIFGLIEVLYFAFMESSSGSSIGKKLIGFRAQMTDGSKTNFGKAFMRNISKIFWPILLLDWLLGVVTPGQDRRQKYFDRMAGTTVVSFKQPFASTPPPPPPPPTQ